MSQQQVADLLRIGRSAYAHWEAGQTLPPVDKLDRVLVLYAVSYEEVVREDLASSQRGAAATAAAAAASVATVAQEPTVPYAASKVSVEERLARLEAFLSAKFPDYIQNKPV